MTTRRTFVAGSLAAAAALALPISARAEPRSARVKTKDSIDWAVGIAMQAGLEATVACVDSFSLTDFRPELASVTVPTLLLHGTADIPVPITLARITARGIRQSTMIEYADVSHGLVVTERDRVTRDLQAFIAR